VKGRSDRAFEEAVELQAPPLSSLRRSYQMRLESLLVADRPRAQLPWLLVAASVLLLVIVVYLFFGAYLPAKQRLARLEAELKDVYTREAQLQTRLAQQEKTHALREQQATALSAERDQLTKRIEELERQLAGAARRR